MQLEEWQTFAKQEICSVLYHHLHEQQKCILGCIWNTSGNHEDEASYEVHTLTVPDTRKKTRVSSKHRS